MVAPCRFGYMWTIRLHVQTSMNLYGRNKLFIVSIVGRFETASNENGSDFESDFRIGRFVSVELYGK